ncbi:MAG: hypothetical protein AB7G13_36330 [Lautropia sp.]
MASTTDGPDGPGPATGSGARPGDGPATRPVAFWLVPASDDHASLSATMATLAGEHAAPVFEPHVTLHVDRAPIGLDIGAAMARIAAAHRPLTLVAGATGHSDVYFQTLFIDLPADAAPAGNGLAAMQALQRALAAAVHRDDPAAADTAVGAYRLAPHLSLLYARLDADRRDALARRETFAGRAIRFDTLAAVRPVAGRSDLAEVDRWDVFGHCRLGGGDR